MSMKIRFWTIYKNVIGKVKEKLPTVIVLGHKFKDTWTRWMSDKKKRQWLRIGGSLFGLLLFYILYSLIARSEPVVQKYCNIYNYETILEKEFECVPLIVQPSPTVCIQSNDHYVSGHIKNSGVWERDKVFAVYRILQRFPSIPFIDLGANIGQFSIIAAKMGHKVIAVEPFANNIETFHKSVQIGKFENNITIVQNPISNTRRPGRLILNGSQNPGGTQLEADVVGAVPGSVDTDVIIMDDLLEVISFKTAIMKTDIEGYEHRAFVNASRFLDQVHIPYIFMEWLFMRELCAGARRQDKHYQFVNLGAVIKTMTPEDERLLFEMMDILIRRGYEPRGDGGVILDIKHCDKWPADIIWIHKSEFT